MVRCTELLEQAESVVNGPVFDDLAILKAGEHHSGPPHLLSCRVKTCKLSLVGASPGVSYRDHITLSDHLIVFYVHIRECRTEPEHARLEAVSATNFVGLRRAVKDVVVGVVSINEREISSSTQIRLSENTANGASLSVGDRRAIFYQQLLQVNLKRNSQSISVCLYRWISGNSIPLINHGYVYTIV